MDRLRNKLTMIRQGATIAGFSLTAMLLGTTYAQAQSTPPPGVTLPSQIPERIEEITPKSTESPNPVETTTPTPPTPLEIPSSDQPSEPTPPKSGKPFRIEDIQIDGNTVLKDEIAKQKQTFLQKHTKRVVQGKKNLAVIEITFEDLIELRSDITQLYLDNGYKTSGAFLPNNQKLAGVIKIQVIEGFLENLEITGLTHLHPNYIRKRLAVATESPLNINRLEKALQLLQIDPLLERVNAELTAGTVPGRNILRLRLQESQPVHVGFSIDNNQSPSVGSIQGNVFASHDNLLGFGDRLSASFGKTEGLTLYDISYAIPLNPLDGKLTLRYSNNDSKIIEDVFRDLEIRSESRTFSIGIRQPLIRSLQTEFALGLSLDLRRSQTYLLDDIPFSFSEGPENGKSRVTVLRFSQDWVNRSATRVLAARSQFSLGINAFDATINDTGTDGQFFAWLGQFQWVQQLSPRTLVLTRLAAQLTPDSLLSLERFSLGGRDTIRGYRQNQLVSDNGILGSIEFRFSLTRDPKILQLSPFIEFGTGWNRQGPAPDPAFIASLGLGLQWQITPGLDLQVDYGIPLTSISDRGSSLQDFGLYFSLRYQPF